MIKEIQERSNRERRKYDHIAHAGICRRCGLTTNYLGKDIYEKYGDMHTDMREKGEDGELICKSPRCLGKVKVKYEIHPERAIRLADITRR